MGLPSILKDGIQKENQRTTVMINTSPGLIPTNLENDKAARLRQTVKDESGKVHQIGEIDFMDGNGFHKVMDIFDSSPNPWMVDRNLYETKSYFWIRNNGSGYFTVRDVAWKFFHRINFLLVRYLYGIDK